MSIGFDTNPFDSTFWSTLRVRLLVFCVAFGVVRCASTYTQAMLLRALRTPVARAHTPAALRAHARPLSALRVPAFLNDARIELYEDSILLRAVSSLTPLGNGRILVKPYDPALTQRIRETLNDALATTGLKAFWDARAANLVVVPKAYRTDSKAARAKQARAVTLDADLEGDANLDALEMLARAKEAPLFVDVGRRSSRPRARANKFESRARQLEEEADDVRADTHRAIRVARRVASGNKKVLRQLAKDACAL